MISVATAATVAPTGTSTTVPPHLTCLKAERFNENHIPAGVPSGCCASLFPVRSFCPAPHFITGCSEIRYSGGKVYASLPTETALHPGGSMVVHRVSLRREDAGKEFDEIVGELLRYEPKKGLNVWGDSSDPVMLV